MFFSKPKYKKIDTIDYKGYDIPIYSNGEKKYAGHPLPNGEFVDENRIYDIEQINKLKHGIFLIKKYGDDVDTTEFFPKSLGTIKISKKDKIKESVIKSVILDYVKNKTP